MATKLHIQKLPETHPTFIDWKAKWALNSGELLGLFQVNQWLHVIYAREQGLLHLSVSHPRRYPTWDELRDIRYALLPNEKTFGILLPPKEQYVNVHENCFHLDEIPSVHEETKSLIIKPWLR